MESKKTRLWEDAPPPVKATKTREVLEAETVETDKARKYFRCEYCEAKRGENCRPFHDEGDGHMVWRVEWDIHDCRHRRWADAHDLERAMLEATDDE